MRPHGRGACVAGGNPQDSGKACKVVLRAFLFCFIGGWQTFLGDKVVCLMALRCQSKAPFTGNGAGVRPHWHVLLAAGRHFRPDGAVRCIGHRSALHRPSQHAASAHAAQCILRMMPWEDSLDSTPWETPPCPYKQESLPRDIPRQALQVFSPRREGRG